jgi:hypothetical protein
MEVYQIVTNPDASAALGSQAPTLNGIRNVFCETLHTPPQPAA